jgi:hypothetical protein
VPAVKADLRAGTRHFSTVKVVAEFAVPPPVTMVIGPVVALFGTVAVIWLFETTVNDAPAPLNLTLVATPIGPVEAVAGTVAVVFVLETTVNVAAVPLNVAAVAPTKPVPLIVTDAPTEPFRGEKL